MQSNDYAEQLANFLDDIKKWVPENQREVLVEKGSRQITGTQGHVLMLLNQRPMTNTELAHKLEISGAAVTKAMHGLKKFDNPVIQPMADQHDARVNRWVLTDYGKELANKHAQEHKKTLTVYSKIFAEFNLDEQKTISKFVKKLTDQFED